jgi:hypothetical protein
MNIYTIYAATNKINGKNYIGFDSKWPKRKYEHHYNSTVGSSNQVFYNAIRKYGWDNFEWNIIYQSHDAEHTLTVMENHFINEYRSYIHFENCEKTISKLNFHRWHGDNCKFRNNKI